MMPRDIVCLSTHYWGDAWFRKQHFMDRFAQSGHRVLYVEPSHSMARPGPDPKLSPNGLAFARLRRESPNVWVLTPAQLLPKPRVRRISEVNHARIIRAVGRAARQIGLRKPIVWAYDPMFAPALHLLGRSHLVFDLVDDYVEYDRSCREYASSCVQTLLAAADRVIYTSRPLEEKYPTSAPSRVVPNGYDDRLFRDQDVRASPGLRRVAFVGTFFRFLDYDVLERVAREVPGATLVLAGRVQPTGERVRQVLRLENVEYHGHVDRKDVPGLVAGADVCIAPFRIDAVSASVSPLKVYEYLATRRPVVCTPMHGFEGEAIARFVDFASSPEDFLRLTEERLAAWPVDQTALTEALRHCTWDSRFAAVEGFLGPALLQGRS